MEERTCYHPELRGFAEKLLEYSFENSAVSDLVERRIMSKVSRIAWTSADGYVRAELKRLFGIGAVDPHLRTQGRASRILE